MAVKQNSFFSKEELIKLEIWLGHDLRLNGFNVESIQLIGMLGEGYTASVFRIMIDRVEHVLKVYRLHTAFTKEIRNLKRVIPPEQFFFVWRARQRGFSYNMVLFEQPDGRELRSNNLKPAIASQLADTLINLHDIRFTSRISVRGILKQIELYEPTAKLHAKRLGISARDINRQIAAAKAYLAYNAATFRVQASRVHGDMWWSNIIVSSDHVYLIDWDQVRRADYAYELARLCVFFDFTRVYKPHSFWVKNTDSRKVTPFMNVILAKYRQHYTDPNIDGRYAFYCWYHGFKQLSDFYAGSLRGSDVARNMYETGVAHLESIVGSR